MALEPLVILFTLLFFFICIIIWQARASNDMAAAMAKEKERQVRIRQRRRDNLKGVARRIRALRTIW